MVDFLFIGPRCSGKTTEIIKKSAETGHPIMVTTAQRREYILKKAKELKYDIPIPIVARHYLFGSDDSYDSGYEHAGDGIYIDEAEDVLRYIFSGIPIKGMTLTTQDVIHECKEGES